MIVRTITAATTAIATVAALSGCETFGNQMVTGPDGTPHILISCGEMRACYARASQACPETQGKYTIVNTTSDTEGVGGRPSTVMTSYEMLIKCGNSGETQQKNSQVGGVK